MDSNTHSAFGRLEVVETGRRRRWSDDEKRRIVMESLGGSRQVSATARRHDVSRTQLLAWRRAMLAKSALSAPGFVPAVMAPDVAAAATAEPMRPRIEVVLRSGRRSGAGVCDDPQRLARLEAQPAASRFRLGGATEHRGQAAILWFSYPADRMASAMRSASALVRTSTCPVARSTDTPACGSTLLTAFSTTAAQWPQVMSETLYCGILISFGGGDGGTVPVPTLTRSRGVSGFRQAGTVGQANGRNYLFIDP